MRIHRAILLSVLLTAFALTLAPVRALADDASDARARQDLIARVEAAYQKGEASYRAGHLSTARAEFNTAFLLMVQSPLALRGDEALEREFDKIVEQINSLEMQALNQGSGLGEPDSSPAPIDEANDVTFPVDPALKARIAAGMKDTHSDLPLVLNDPVASFVNFYSTRSHGTITRALTRAGRYRAMIQRIFAEEGVPQDLIYLAQAESGFEPRALSRAGARGMWQFMASAADLFDLKHNFYVDERLDPEKSTRAAARYLSRLHTLLGDWWLAMAAYNTGGLNMQRAVQRTGYADFWELHDRGVLLGETRNYVPIIIAMTIMAKNPQQYGLENVVPDPPFEYDSVPVDYSVDLSLVAESVDSSTNHLRELNPALLRGVTPRDQTYDLRLPKGTGESFRKAMEAIPVDMRASAHFYKAQPGETLADVAKRFGATAEAIAEANNLSVDDELPRDAKLVVPVRPGRNLLAASAASSADAAKRLKTIRYKVRKGDTLASIASDFGVETGALLKWNHLRRGKLTTGQSMLVYQPTESSSHAVSQSEREEARGAEGTQKCVYKKQPGHKKPTRVCTPIHQEEPKKSAKGKKVEEEKPEPKCTTHRDKHGKRVTSCEPAVEEKSSTKGKKAEEAKPEPKCTTHRDKHGKRVTSCEPVVEEKSSAKGKKAEEAKPEPKCTTHRDKHGKRVTSCEPVVEEKSSAKGKKAEEAKAEPDCSTRRARRTAACKEAAASKQAPAVKSKKGAAKDEDEKPSAAVKGKKGKSAVPAEKSGKAKQTEAEPTKKSSAHGKKPAEDEPEKPAKHRRHAQ